MSRSEPSPEEASYQAGECGGQQGGQRQRQQASWGLGPEHLALAQSLRGPDVVCHLQCLSVVVVVVQLLRECKDLWGDGAQWVGQVGRAALPLCDLSPVIGPL